MIFLEFAIAILGICLIALVIMWKFSRKRITPQEDVEGCKVRQMYPDENDPDYAFDQDNTPPWRLKTGQRN